MAPVFFFVASFLVLNLKDQRQNYGISYTENMLLASYL